MESLLKTILNECEKHKLMYRANAYDLFDNGGEDMIVPWGYDFPALADTFKEIELDERRGNIQLLPAHKVKTHKQLIKSIRKNALANCYDEYLEHFKTCDDEQLIKEFPQEYYCGDYAIVWTNYGGNTNTDCFTDYTGLDDYFNVSELTEKWEDQIIDFELGLI